MAARRPGGAVPARASGSARNSSTSACQASGSHAASSRLSSLPAFSTASSRRSQRDGTVGVPSTRAARVSTTSRAPSACAKSCAAMPTRRSGGGMPKLRAHRARQPRIALGLGRPHALVEAAEHEPVGMLQPRLEQAPDEEPRMAPEGRPHHRPGDERLEQRRIVAAGEVRAFAGGVEELARDLRRRLARGLAPQPRGAGLRRRSAPAPRRRRCGRRRGARGSSRGRRGQR